MLGKLPYDPDKPNVHLSRMSFAALSPFTRENKPVLPPAPSSLDRLTPCMRTAAGLPMYGNGRFGCCVWSMIGHAIQAMTLLNWGPQDEQTVTEEALLKGYSDVTGFDPNDPSTDRGTTIQDALNYWRKVGIKKPDGTMDKILAFAEVDVSDNEMMRHAIDIFDVMLVGVSLPQSAEDQFNEAKPWTYVPGSKILGGHAILDGGYEVVNSAGALEHVEGTWAEAIRVQQDFWDHYADEAWIVITADLLDRNGGSPRGFNMDIFAADFEAVTGKPFHPDVPPSPSPTPPPVVPQDFQSFKLVAEQWLGHRHTGVNATFARHLDEFIKANS